MKRFIPHLLVSLVLLSATPVIAQDASDTVRPAGNTYVRVSPGSATLRASGPYAKITAISSSSPWLQVQDTVGWQLNVALGSCKIELTMDPPTECTANTAVPADLDIAEPYIDAPSSTVGVIEKASCVRLNCVWGEGTLRIKR